MAATPHPETDFAQRALDAPTLCAAFQITSAARGDAVALRTPDDSISITWSEYGSRVRSIAEGLASLGVGSGGAVALLMNNRPEVNLVDTAAIHLGAAAFSIYFTNPPEEIVPLLRNSGARIVITESLYLDRVLKTRELHPDLEHIIVVDSDGGDLTLEELEGRTVDGFDFDAAWQNLDEKDVVTLVYTSGTTGEPKGVQHTHLSLMYGLRGLDEFDPVTPCGRLVAFLPMAHIAERWISHYASMVWGHTITCCADPKTLPAALGSAKPTRMFGVPRVFEKLAAAIEGMAAKDPEGGLATALAKGKARVEAEQAAGTSPSRHAPGEDGLDDTDRATLAAVRDKIGLGDLEWTCVAAAPSARSLHVTYHALGIPLLQIWGMSECIFSTCTPADRIKLGTVGHAVPGVEVKLADDGEILVKGPNLMLGYRNEPQKTAETIDADGWLHSGDIAVEEEGFLRIVDRKKELIINSGGKNIAPQKVETAVKERCPLIAQVTAIGDAKLYITALVVLDEDAATAYATEHGIEGGVAAVAADPEVQQQVADAVAGANETLARVEQIKAHTILPVAWAPGGDEITPTMKLKRRNITEKYESEIDALYAS